MSGSVLDGFTRLIDWRRSGLNRWQLYKEIILPGAMPSILVGLRFSLGLVWVLLGKLADVFAQLLERYLLRWHSGYQK